MNEVQVVRLIVIAAFATFGGFALLRDVRRLRQFPRTTSHALQNSKTQRLQRGRFISMGAAVFCVAAVLVVSLFGSAFWALVFMIGIGVAVLVFLVLSVLLGWEEGRLLAKRDR